MYAPIKPDAVQVINNKTYVRLSKDKPEPRTSFNSLGFTNTSSLDKTANARLRGWQRITTKLKHNNRNHRGS
ncbi:hypothetical protein I7101_000029 [Vibrio cholerae]|nr:hypothetical protein [Vibrio cholerae]